MDRIPEELRKKIPQIGKAEQPDPMVWGKLSAEALGTTWYIIEARWLATDAISYGYVVGWDDELTYFNCSELEFLSAKEAVAIAYDPTFVSCRLSEVMAYERGDGPKFPLGQLVATPGAVEAFERSRQSPTIFVRRHRKGDWGDLDVDDIQENEFSLTHELRLLSAYILSGSSRRRIGR